MAEDIQRMQQLRELILNRCGIMHEDVESFILGITSLPHLTKLYIHLVSNADRDYSERGRILCNVKSSTLIALCSMRLQELVVYPFVVSMENDVRVFSEEKISFDDSEVAKRGIANEPTLKKRKTEKTKLKKQKTEAVSLTSWSWLQSIPIQYALTHLKLGVEHLKEHTSAEAREEEHRFYVWPMESAETLLTTFNQSVCTNGKICEVDVMMMRDLVDVVNSSGILQGDQRVTLYDMASWCLAITHRYAQGFDRIEHLGLGDPVGLKNTLYRMMDAGVKVKNVKNMLPTVMAFHERELKAALVSRLSSAA